MIRLPDVLQRHIEPEPMSGCWLWSGCAGATEGYGRVGYKGKKYDAHRLVYTLLVGPVAQGKDLDHRCRVRPCVNPSHLREATRRENLMAPGSQSIAKTHAEATSCISGHAFTHENTYRWHGHRLCRECRREADRRRRKRT